MCPGISSDLFLLPSSQLNLQLFYYPQEDHFSFLVYRKEKGKGKMAYLTDN